MTVPRSIHVAANGILSYGWVIFLCISGPHVYLLLCWWTFSLLPCLGYCKYCCNLHWGDCSIFELWFSQDICSGVRLLDIMVVLFFYCVLLSIINLKCCVSFRCITEWFSYTYTYSLIFRFFCHTDYYRLLSRVPCVIQ